MDIDVYLDQTNAEKELQQHGIETKLEINTLLFMPGIAFDGVVEHVTVIESERRKTYAVWFRDSNARIEFDIKDDQVVMLDAYSVDVSTYGDFGHLRFSPTDKAKNRRETSSPEAKQNSFKLLEFPKPTEGDSHEER